VGFFAVLPRDGVAPGRLRVAELHLNVWCLGGVAGHNLVVDVGLLLLCEVSPGGTESLTPDAGPIDGVRLVLPFRASRMEDLSARVLDPRAGALIFDANVSVDGDALVFPRGQPHGRLTVTAVNAVTSAAEVAYTTIPSVWKVNFARAIEPGVATYVRVRFYVSGRTPMWQWRRSIVAKNGALVDLRVSDVRGAVQTSLPAAELTDRAATIGSVRAFVIVPSRYQAPVQNPPARYVRLLEGSAWRPYLNRATQAPGRGKMVVYYQRSNASPHQDVTIDTPFRAFLGLNREPPMPPAMSAVRPAIIAIVIALALLRAPLRAGATETLTASARWLTSRPWVTGGIGASLLALWTLVRRARQGKKVAARVVRAIDAMVYRVLP
jgi:hypothetical protein